MRLLALGVLMLACLPMASPAMARGGGARRFIPPRTVVQVRPGWPIKRPARSVVVHPVRTETHTACSRYVEPISFASAPTPADAAPTRDMITWEDGEMLQRAEDWTEFTLNCDTPGHRIWLEIPGGRAQFDWAEVVYQNGDSQVVDFGEKTLVPGLYSLLDLADGRVPDHVRVVARARTEEAKVLLRIQKH
jgi:hypothetical protein